MQYSINLEDKNSDTDRNPVFKLWKYIAQIVESNYIVRMGVVDKLLCNLILMNLRMSTNIIAAMNLVSHQ